MWALRLLPPLRLLLLLLLVLSTTTNAAVIPFNNSGAGSSPPSSSSHVMCRPKLSGLVQQIRKSGDPQVMWKSVITAKDPSGTITDGVQAVRLSRGSNIADSDLAYEWFIEGTAEPGVYSIASATAPQLCSDSPGTSTRSTQGQHAFVDEADMDKGATPRPSCFPAHLVKAAPSFLCLRALERDPDVGSSPLQFRLVCQSCEPHEDSASRCLIQSVFTNRCVELVLPGSAKSKNLDETLDTRVMERPHLGWADCSLEDDLNGGGPWTRSGRRDQQDAALRKLQRQLWDIAP